MQISLIPIQIVLIFQILMLRGSYVHTVQRAIHTATRALLTVAIR